MKKHISSLFARLSGNFPGVRRKRENGETQGGFNLKQIHGCPLVLTQIVNDNRNPPSYRDLGLYHLGLVEQEIMGHEVIDPDLNLENTTAIPFLDDPKILPQGSDLAIESSK